MGNLQDGVQSAKIWWKSNTLIGAILFIAPTILRLINPEWVDIDLQAGSDEVFNQAEQIAVQAEAGWAVISKSLGSILLALGLRKAAGGTPLKVI